MHDAATKRWRIVNAQEEYRKRFAAQLERDIAFKRIKPFDVNEFLRSKGIPESILHEE
jgi:hypothetical protein